jgi:hypothetical protein
MKRTLRKHSPNKPTYDNVVTYIRKELGFDYIANYSEEYPENGKVFCCSYGVNEVLTSLSPLHLIDENPIIFFRKNELSKIRTLEMVNEKPRYICSLTMLLNWIEIYC